MNLNSEQALRDNFAFKRNKHQVKISEMYSLASMNEIFNQI